MELLRGCQKVWENRERGEKRREGRVRKPEVCRTEETFTVLLRYILDISRHRDQQQPSKRQNYV